MASLGWRQRQPVHFGTPPWFQGPVEDRRPRSVHRWRKWSRPTRIANLAKPEYLQRISVRTFHVGLQNRAFPYRNGAPILRDPVSASGLFRPQVSSEVTLSWDRASNRNMVTPLPWNNRRAQSSDRSSCATRCADGEAASLAVGRGGPVVRRGSRRTLGALGLREQSRGRRERSRAMARPQSPRTIHGSTDAGHAGSSPL
jgi:hypothetical protein